MRTAFDALVTEKTLRCLAIRRNADVMNLIADDRIQNDVPMKNVCFKTLPDVSDDVDEVVAMLGVHKREFLEAAVLDAVSRAWDIMKREGLVQAPDDSEHGINEAA